MQEYIENQFKELSGQLQELQSAAPAVVKIANICIKAIKNGHKVIWCGNGGSAAQSQHLAAELIGRYKIKRPAMKSVSLVARSAVCSMASRSRCLMVA